MKNIIDIHNIHSLIICILIILYMLFPFNFQIYKLLLIIYIITISLYKSNVHISKKLVIWTFGMVIYNSIYIVIGIIKNNPGVTYYIPTYILWPILYMILSSCINKNDTLQILKTLKLSIWIIICMGILAFIKFNYYIEPEGTFLIYSACLRPGFPFIAISSSQITVFIFWYFFFFSLDYIQYRNLSFINYIYIITGIIYIFATSRRIIYISFIISLFLIYILSYFLDYKNSKLIKSRIRNSVIWISILITFLIGLLVFYNLIKPDSMTEFFDKTSEKSDIERVIQSNSLIEGWMESPLFGAGTGIDSSIKRSDIPGTYELSYLAKLFETGMIGFIIYCILWILLFYWTIQCLNSHNISKKYIIAALCSMSIFMISNATNPYIGAFDYMWFMYVPFVIINLSNKQKIIVNGNY